MVTIFHQTKNTYDKIEVAYFFFLFTDKTFHFEAREFESEINAEMYIKKVKLDCFLINFERMLSTFKFSEPNHEITNAISRCRKFFEWTKDKREEYDAFVKYVPMILPFVNLLPQAVEPEKYYEMKLMAYMFNELKW